MVTTSGDGIQVRHRTLLVQMTDGFGDHPGRWVETVWMSMRRINSSMGCQILRAGGSRVANPGPSRIFRGYVSASLVTPRRSELNISRWLQHAGSLNQRVLTTLYMFRRNVPRAPWLARRWLSSTFNWHSPVS